MVNFKKIKIIFFIDDLKIGGAEKLLLQTINHLDHSKFTIILLTLSNEGKLFSQLPDKLEKVYVTKNPFKIFRILQNEKPDIFHSHLWKSDFIGLPLAKLAKIPKIFTTKHNVHYFRGLKKLLIPIDAFVSNLTSNVITISNAVKHFYKKNYLYNKTKFQVIYNGIDLAPFNALAKKRELRNTDSNFFYILTVANLTKQKGHEDFLKILHHIKNYNFEWHLVGKGILEKQITQKAKKLKILDKIIFHGEQVNVMPFYEKADLFVLPSKWEGFGLVLIEAIATKIPIFASNVDGIQEIIKITKAGTTFDIMNINDSLEKLKELIINKEFRKNTTDYKDISEFTIDKMVNQLTLLYIK